MKVLAVVNLAASADISELQHHLSDELRESWKLFSANVIREAYMTDDPSRVVFVFEAENTIAAETRLQELPLIKRGVFTVQLIELRPFTNWTRLFAERI